MNTTSRSCLVLRSCLLAGAFTAIGATAALAQLKATLVAGGFDRPVAFVQNPADSTMQVVVQQSGRVRVLKDGALLPNDYLTLAGQIAVGGEQGLLGFAFAPDYATSGRVFVNFTDLSGHTVIARFVRSVDDPLRADPATRFDLVWPDGSRVIRQPFTNHNGGHLAFGPDGFLYIGLGDGGSGDDPFNHAQNPGSLLGKMLRIDVSVAANDPEGYNIPSGNPFVGRADVHPEIWSFGLRNPWRWSFDDPRLGGNGALIIADVGQNAREEIDYEPAGAGGRNYGWRNREGTIANITSAAPFFEPLVNPVFEYARNIGRSITGGFVYRGEDLGAAYNGRYFFADFVTSRVWSLGLVINAATREATAGTLVEHTAEFGSAAASPSSFGVDAAGELYLVSYSGAIYRLTLASGAPVGDKTSKRRATGETIGIAGPRR